MFGFSSFGRSDTIRTCDILLPKQARYQLRYTPIRFRILYPEILVLIILFYLRDIVNNVLVKLKICEKIFSSSQTKTQVIFSVICCLLKKNEK